ncbi:TetR/AcrR family transcriptional regulator [Micromonospora sp. DT233]|uniref:TetR/AcrR family transcriptional regulator n=1 Tax=Micromonospora sp. DT233 TaxID=3393432 RepID=UPI003CF6C8F2
MSLPATPDDRARQAEPAPAEPPQGVLRRGRGRRPTEQVRAEILAAAGHLLLSEGMATFTIERVAALAGASKTTIYKWWPSRGALAIEGYARTVDAALAVPDTGDIEHDLTTQLLTYAQLLRATPAGKVTAELLGAAQTDPLLAESFRRTYSTPRRAVGLAALRTAQERGQIRCDADAEVLIDQLWGTCLYRLMMRDQPLTDDFVRAVVRNLMDGVRPTGAPGPNSAPAAGPR